MQEWKDETVLTYLRVWNDKGELPLHRLCANADLYPEALKMLAEADPDAAGCRDDRGLTAFHYLARNPGCTVVLLETLFPFANQVYQAPKWQERAKFSMPGWRPSPSTVEIMAFKGQYHALSSIDTFGKTVLHYLCKNENSCTKKIDWVLQKEMLVALNVPALEVAMCYAPLDKHGPLGRGRYLLTRYVDRLEEYEGGADPWELALAGLSGLLPEIPQTSLFHRDIDGHTPLHAACQHELDPEHKRKKKSFLTGVLTKDATSSVEIINKLAGVAPEICKAKDMDGRTPMHLLCSNSTIKWPLLMKLLKNVHFQTAVREPDVAARVPLHALCLNPSLATTKPRMVSKMLRALLRHHKAAAGLVDQFGCTPLHYLCMRGRPTRDQVKILLRADPSAAAMVDESGRIPADSIWLNTVMQERQIESMSSFLLKASTNAEEVLNNQDEGEDEEVFDHLEQSDHILGGILRTSSPFKSTGTSQARTARPGTIQEQDEPEEEQADEDEDEEDEEKEEREKEREEEKGLQKCAEEYPHCIQITLVKAEGLFATDWGGTSDPFVRLMVDDSEHNQYQTPTIKATQNPAWDCTFDVLCDVHKSVMQIAVFDEDDMLITKSEELLGSVSIVLASAEDGERWYDLNARAPALDKRKLRVRVLKAQGLLAKDKGATSDPLAELLLGSQKRETKVLPKTLSPEWNEEFNLEFTPGGGEQMDVVLYDNDKGLLSNSKEFLGAVTIHLDHIMADMEFNQWHELEHNPKYQKKQEDVTGMVQLDISWSESKDDRSSAPGSSSIMPLAREETAGIPVFGLADVSENTAIRDSRTPPEEELKTAGRVLVKMQGLVTDSACSLV
jgi:ankyrin repeat protein